jgi:cell wall-associated NlpC family hydrolase
MNCWDLSVYFYLSEFGIDLKHIHSEKDTPPREETRNLIYSNKGEFEQVVSPEFGDLIVLKVLGIESHIAIYIGNGKMLHTSKRIGSVVERVEKFKKHIFGYFRIRQ